MVEIKVREIMHRQVTTVGEDENLGLARQIMLWSGLRHLPVVGRPDSPVVGMLGERELLRALAGSVDSAEALGRPVRDFALAPVDPIGPDATIAEAAAALATSKVGCLLVLEQRQLVGTLMTADVLAVLAPTPSTGPAAARGAAGEVRVSAIMHPDPIAVRAHDTLLATAARMAKIGVRHACVVDDAGGLLGIISDRDVRRVLGDPQRALAPSYVPEHLHRLPVGHVMSMAVVVDQDASVRDALALLLSEQVGALPVVDGWRKLRGIVSYVDVLQHFAGAPPPGDPTRPPVTP